VRRGDGHEIGRLKHDPTHASAVAAEVSAAAHLSYWFMLALAAVTAADLSAGIHALTHHELWEWLRLLSSTAASLLFLRAVWRDGVQTSLALQTSCGLVGLLFTLSLVTVDLSTLWSPAPLPQLVSCVAVARGMLAVRCVCAVLGATAGGGRRRGRELHPASLDEWRLGAQLLGSLLLVSSLAMELGTPTRAVAATFGMGMERMATVAFTGAAWLMEYPQRDSQPPRPDEPVGRYDSLEDLKVAHADAARRRRAAAAAVPVMPLLQDSSAGGIQGLRWCDQELCNDLDGDEAHEFWEALSNGLFMKVSKAG